MTATAPRPAGAGRPAVRRAAAAGGPVDPAVAGRGRRSAVSTCSSGAPLARPAAGSRPCTCTGSAGASTNWTDYAALLATRLDGDALDLPGFGGSGPAPARGGYGLAAQARTVLAYLERRAAGPVHLVGNSMGGVAALLVAATRPELVRTLTLVSPAMPWLRPRRGSDFAMPLLLCPASAGTPSAG